MKKYIFILIILIIVACDNSSSDNKISSNNLNNSKVLKTGQHVTYINFDDGYYKKGIEHQYIRNDNKELIIDNTTNLMWQDNVEAKELTVSWYSAKTYCSNLTLASYTNWRLPRRVELETLVDYGKYDPSISNIFKNISTYNNWTSTNLSSDNSQAWLIFFISGQQDYNYKDQYGSVRCVRDI